VDCEVDSLRESDCEVLADSLRLSLTDSEIDSDADSLRDSDADVLAESLMLSLVE